MGNIAQVHGLEREAAVVLIVQQVHQDHGAMDQLGPGHMQGEQVLELRLKSKKGIISLYFISALMQDTASQRSSTIGLPPSK